MSRFDECLTSDELTGLLTGSEPDEPRSRMIAHLDKCADCRAVLADCARHLMEPAGERTAFERAVWIAMWVLVLVAVWWLLRAV